MPQAQENLPHASGFSQNRSGAAGRKISRAIEPGSDCDRRAAETVRQRVRPVAGAAGASPDRARLGK
jgi:hypothetical protein